MKIIEKIRSAPDPTLAPTRALRRTPVPEDEGDVDRLTRLLRRANERNSAEFDRGFQAAILMVRAGADLDRLMEASGVVAAEFEDTQPVVMSAEYAGWDQEDTLVQTPTFASGQEAG